MICELYVDPDLKQWVTKHIWGTKGGGIWIWNKDYSYFGMCSQGMVVIKDNALSL